MIVKVVVPDSIYARVYFARGEQGPQGPTGNTGPQGPSGIVNVDSPITNSGTSTSANIGLNQALLQITPAQVTGTAVITTDSRLGDQRVPTDGSVTDTKIVAGGLSTSAITGTAVITTDSRLSDARTPTAHAATHGSAGSDPVTLAQSQVTNLVSDLAAKAPIASPTFTGTVTIPFSATFLQSSGTGQLQAVASAPGLGYVPYTASVATGIAWQNLATLVKTDSANTFTVGGHAINNANAAVIPLIVKAASSQSANLMEFQDSSAVWQTRISPVGQIVTNVQAFVGSGSTSISNSRFNVATGSASVIGAVIRGAASQSANLQEWQNSAGTVLGFVTSSGVGRFEQVQINSGYASLAYSSSGGSLRLVKKTAAQANIGANIGDIYFRDGTNAGTLKLVVRAGAAGAETTILDNIPQ